VTLESERLTLAAFSMEGQALPWFQWMANKGQLTSWVIFLNTLQSRFTPSQYDDPTRALVTLTQRGTINSYLSKFEMLANQIAGLPPPFLLSCFIFGFTLKIHREVQALQSLTLAQVVGLAKLQEEKFLDLHRSLHGRSLLFYSSPPPATSSNPTSLPLLLPSPPKPPPPLPVKRLTLEIASRQEQGLCFNCNEKFCRGHQCASKIFLLIVDEEHDSALDTPFLDSTIKHMGTTNSIQMHISVPTLSGHLVLETLRVLGLIDNYHVTILIDGGSTQSFI